VKKTLQILLLSAFFSVTSLSYAESKLTVTNDTYKYPGGPIYFEIEVVTDLLCGKSADGITAQSKPYTVPLQGNPIEPKQTKDVSWKDCVMPEWQLFGDIKASHSKIYLKIKDVYSGESLESVFLIARGTTQKNITFAGKNFFVDIYHNGKYFYDEFPRVHSTETTIKVS